MKLLWLLFILCVLWNGNVCYSQDTGQNFNDAWLVTKVENSIGMKVRNDLPFSALSFLSINKVEIYLNFVINDRDKRTDEYAINDSVLIIDDYYQVFKYNIIKKSEREMVLNKGENYYYFEKLLRCEKDCFIFTNDSLPLSTGAIDTIKIFNYIPPGYKGNLYDFFVKNIPDDMHKDTAYLLNLTFILKADRELDSIKVFPESYQQYIESRIFPLMKNKWNMARLNDKRTDSKIKLTIFIASKREESLNITNPLKLSQKLFNMGADLIADSIQSEALNYFLDCEKIFDSYETCDYYSIKKGNYLLSLQNLWINSIMNQALIYYQTGNLDASCTKWYKAAPLDKEAYKYYKDNCSP